MNERDIARQEARKRDREIADKLAEIGIQPSEASLFNVVHYGLTVPPADLCRRAALCDYSVGGLVTAEENLAGLTDCLSKGWLQIVDEAVLSRIQDEVRREGLLGPIYDYPSLGGVEFTPAGAEQWFRIREHCWGRGRDESFAFHDTVHEKTAHYYSSESTALAERDLWKEDESVVSVTGPFPIGPWRANWWRRFPEGYRIDVEYRMQWQGRCSSGGGYSLLKVVTLPVDVVRTVNVLNRHNVALVEWLVLTSLETMNQQRGIVREVNTSGLKRFRVNLTEAECVAGLEACLRNGWLRRMDEQGIAEIHRRINADCAVMPVPFDSKKLWVEVDFSDEGARLYRMLSAEIFGTDWELGLLVENTYYREEHRYCATEAGLVAVRQEYAESDEIPRSIRTVLIGPWCVHWWLRFHSGYRLELTFGEPG